VNICLHDSDYNLWILMSSAKAEFDPGFRAAQVAAARKALAQSAQGQILRR